MNSPRAHKSPQRTAMISPCSPNMHYRDKDSIELEDATISVHYQISKSHDSPSISLTLLLPWKHRKAAVPRAFEKISYANQHILSLPLSPPVASNAITPYWLDCNTIRKRLMWGGEALHFNSGDLVLVMYMIEHSAMQLVQLNEWCCLDERAESLIGRVIVNENLATFTARIAYTTPLHSSCAYNFETHVAVTPPPVLFRQQRNGSANHLDDAQNALLSLGYSPDQVNKAVTAMNTPFSVLDHLDQQESDECQTQVRSGDFSSWDNNQGTNDNEVLDTRHLISSIGSPMLSRELMLDIFDLDEQDFESHFSGARPFQDDASETSPDHCANHRANEIEEVINTPEARSLSIGSSNVWSNSGKIDMIKSSPTPAPAFAYETNAHQVDRKSEFSLPESTRGFIFICNSQTRDECFSRNIFGAPAGAEYGPHGQIRKGDLLFLADFSEKTLTGIFEADCSPGMNLEYDAFGGAYPWQIRIRKRETNDPKIRKISLAQAFAFMRLEFGARLNLLSRAQLMSLLQSAEFAPCLPSQYMREVTVLASKQVTAAVVSPPSSGLVSSRKQKIQAASSSSYIGIRKPAQIERGISANEEHPATSLARLKALMSWLHKFTKSILDKNSKYMVRRANHKELPEWNIMQYNDVHSGVSFIFTQWLFSVHAIEATESKYRDGGSSTLDSIVDEAQNWTRARSKGGTKKKLDDPVLRVSYFPSVTEKVKCLLKGASGPSPLNIPTEDLANEFMRKFRRDIETIENEVKSTQHECLRLNGSLDSTRLDIRVFPNEFDNAEITLQWRTKSSLKANRPAPSQTIYRVYFDKLCKRYYCQNDPDKKLMLTRIFVLLCRYDLVSLSNWCQASIPPRIFDMLRDLFGVSHECFASPLDHLCPSYNSIFPDIDQFFGSVGSFFDFFPTQGSFQCNPPNDSTTTVLMLHHILELLQRSTKTDEKPLSFILFLSNTDCVRDGLMSSTFFRRIEYLDKSNEGMIHKFVKGCQHKRNNYPISSTNEAPEDPRCVTWLQNDYGYNLWTPTDEKVSKLLVDGFSK